VAIAYFQLRSLDLSLEIARQTVGSRRNSLRLVGLREEGGVVSMMDVYQAQTLLSGALREIPDFERQIEQTENLISVLLGQNPGPVARGRGLEGQISLPSLPAGLPAALLERRPDVRLAEQQLVAANARIGVAKADFFPRIFLLGSIGVAGGVQNSVSFGPMGFFGVGPTMSVPIFNMGRVRAGVDSAEARVAEAVTRYQQSVQLAVREVSDSLVGYRKRQEARQEQGGSSSPSAEWDRALERPPHDGSGNQLPRGPDSERRLHLRADLGAGAAERAPWRWSALPGPRGRLGAVDGAAVRIGSLRFWSRELERPPVWRSGCDES
jgi:multidrug efflux system outer membrane protein